MFVLTFSRGMSSFPVWYFLFLLFLLNQREKERERDLPQGVVTWMTDTYLLAAHKQHMLKMKMAITRMADRPPTTGIIIRYNVRFKSEVVAGSLAELNASHFKSSLFKERKRGALPSTSSKHTSSKNTLLPRSPVPVKVIVTLREPGSTSELATSTAMDVTHCHEPREGKGRVRVVRLSASMELPIFSSITGWRVELLVRILALNTCVCAIHNVHSYQ